MNQPTLSGIPPEVMVQVPEMPNAEPEDDFDYYGDEPYCQTCNEYGQELVCCDDMCHGIGACMHNDLSCDGYITCRECGGESKL